MGRHPLELAECLLGWVDASAERLARWADPLTTDRPTPSRVGQVHAGMCGSLAERPAQWADPLTTDRPIPSRVGRVPAGMGGCLGREASGVGRSANNGLADTLSRRPSACWDGWMHRPRG